MARDMEVMHTHDGAGALEYVSVSLRQSTNIAGDLLCAKHCAAAAAAKWLHSCLTL